MTAWITTQRHWLTVERLPGYAHDINPIEMVWGNVKQVELANLCPDTIDEAHAAAESGLDRIGSSYDLCFAFLAHTDLSITLPHSITERSLMRRELWITPTRPVPPAD